jgi:hypothetical protein
MRAVGLQQEDKAMDERSIKTGMVQNAGRLEVPKDVRAAVERMCEPLHESHLTGVTASEDARCMKLIHEYVLGGRAQTEAELDAEEARRDEIICRHLDKVLPRGNGGRPLVHDAILKILTECFPAQATAVYEAAWISVADSMPEEGIEVFTRTTDPVQAGDVLDTDWLEEGHFCAEKGPVSHWRPKYPRTVRYPVQTEFI